MTPSCASQESSVCWAGSPGGVQASATRLIVAPLAARSRGRRRPGNAPASVNQPRDFPGLALGRAGGEVLGGPAADAAGAVHAAQVRDPQPGRRVAHVGHGALDRVDRVARRGSQFSAFGRNPAATAAPQARKPSRTLRLPRSTRASPPAALLPALGGHRLAPRRRRRSGRSP